MRHVHFPRHRDHAVRRPFRGHPDLPQHPSRGGDRRAKELHLWIGAINTVVLLTSSLAVAVAVHAARAARPGLVARCLAGAALLGLVFLGLKAFEYHWEYTEGLLPLVGSPAPVRTRPAVLTDLFLSFSSPSGLTPSI